MFLFEWVSVCCQSPDVSAVDFLVMLFDRNTSMTTFQRFKARRPSIRSPASNEIISDSVELWDTDVCFLHIQLTKTSARLPNIHKLTVSEVDFKS